MGLCVYLTALTWNMRCCAHQPKQFYSKLGSFTLPHIKITNHKRGLYTLRDEDRVLEIKQQLSKTRHPFHVDMLAQKLVQPYLTSPCHVNITPSRSRLTAYLHAHQIFQHINLRPSIN